MSTIADRIATLESELAALKAAPVTKHVSAPADDDEGVRITYPKTFVALPTSAEFVKLRRLVDETYPALRFAARNPRFAAAAEAEDAAGFESAFRFVATLARVEKLATGIATSWWVDSAEAWARELGLPSTMPSKAFLAAIVAHADVVFSDFGDFPAFGLAIGGHGCRYSGKWRVLLATGEVPRPVAKVGAPRPAPPRPSQVLTVGAPHAAA